MPQTTENKALRAKMNGGKSGNTSKIVRKYRGNSRQNSGGAIHPVGYHQRIMSIVSRITEPKQLPAQNLIGTSLASSASIDTQESLIGSISNAHNGMMILQGIGKPIAKTERLPRVASSHINSLDRGSRR